MQNGKSKEKIEYPHIQCTQTSNILASTERKNHHTKVIIRKKNTRIIAGTKYDLRERFKCWMKKQRETTAHSVHMCDMSEKHASKRYKKNV